ncbi:transposase [Ktedonobacter sp. SOSP1-85]|uniref:IS66 family transposase n=1 Tax=Ktedonobacter sp. SOSP1-85 TaxID=2778367 RepID=UPI0019160248|nr:IS66 family transposase [Ktedonobacter sp. SOSP1-85]GHO72452.1 transposase [Ktedonobacter sp. SOSP1-85]
MTHEEEIAHLREENQALREALSQALTRIEELEKQKTPPPAFVKANVKKPGAQEKKPRKKRDAKHNHGRTRMVPTQIVEHRIVTCPDCHLRLGGMSLARVREVIDVPPPPPLEVIHHRIFHGWCAQCHKWHEAPVDLHAEVFGQGRIGVRLSSLIATLRTVMRLPIRQIRELLHTLHGFEVSIGEIVEVLHRLVAHAQPVLDGFKATIRASPAVQADETGWREDGLNGYIWSVSTPTFRYYEYHHSRGGEVVKQLIGEAFQGVLGSDFYAGYNIHEGLHQRCWVHFLRNVHELKKKFPQDEALLTWAKEVKAIYDDAVAWARLAPDPRLTPRAQHQARVAQQHVFEQGLWKLCHPFLQEDVPQQTLCKRVGSFLPELFVFVTVPGVPAHNNLAERSVRPLVIARKVSGGTHSPKGSQTRMGLASLFGTWVAQGLNPFSQCLALLTQPVNDNMQGRLF